MKISAPVFLCVCLLGCTTEREVPSTVAASSGGLNITTRSGNTYRNCHIHDVTPDGLKIRQGKQVTTINFQDLPADLQGYFKYDARQGRRTPALAADEAYQAWQRRVARHEEMSAWGRAAESERTVRLAREQREAARWDQEQRRRESNCSLPVPTPEPPRPSVPAPVRRRLPALE